MNERLGIVEQRQADRALYGKFLYRAPVILAPAAVFISVPSARKLQPEPISRTFTRRPRRPVFSARVSDILRACAEAYGISVGELVGRDKPNWIARPRFAAVGLLRGILKISHPQIGKILDRDHTTSLSALRRAVELRAQDPDFRHRYRTAACAVRRKWMAA